MFGLVLSGILLVLDIVLVVKTSIDRKVLLFLISSLPLVFLVFWFAIEICKYQS